MSEGKLAGFLKRGKDWGRMRTSAPGVFVLRLPEYKVSPPRLAVEVNPADEMGRPRKRKGLILRTGREVEEFREMFQYQRLSKLIAMLEAVNPEAVKPGKGEEIIEL